MVKLRLKRIGKKKSAFYRIVVSDARVQRDGKYIDLLGVYQPINDQIKINKELTLKWLFQGAQPTDTVKSILSKNGILKTFHEEKLALKMKNKKNQKKKVAKKEVAKKEVSKNNE